MLNIVSMCIKYIYIKKNIVISQKNDFQKTENEWEGEPYNNGQNIVGW